MELGGKNMASTCELYLERTDRILAVWDRLEA